MAFLDSGTDCHLIFRDLYDKLGLDSRRACSEMQLANSRVEKFSSYLEECAIRDGKNSCRSYKAHVNSSYGITVNAAVVAVRWLH